MTKMGFVFNLDTCLDHRGCMTACKLYNKTPMGVEIIRRAGSENDWLFIINHTHSQVKLDNPPLSLGPMGVRVMAVAKPRAKAAGSDDSTEKIPE